ncbi:kinase-like domain-containing protein [Mycena haematopus]|nr:kinase-like domain-containing protein [Mycena haematopus]
MGSPFVFMVVEDLEEGQNYGPGGFFPVHLGQILGPEGSPRYRICAKLGYGSYSTVWLARDLVARRTVAVKIVQASESSTSCEAAILKHLCTGPISDPPGVLQLLDSFTLTSANGIHQALVTEPVILLQDLLKLPGASVESNTRSLVRQALEALAFIHQRGIAHGDLYPSNIGAAIPDLDSFSEVDIWNMCGPPTIIPLVACDPAYDMASFPPYLTDVINLGELLISKVPGFAAREPRVRILDLGCAFLEDGSPSPAYKTPRSYAAPEVAFPMIAHNNRDAPWDRRADIWAMGCTLLEIARGGPLFGRIGSYLLDDIAAFCGGAPAEWIAHFATVPNKFRPRAYTPEVADALWAKREERLQRRGHTAEDARGLVALLRRMLVIDPMQRPSASELLQDPYLDLNTTPIIPGALYIILLGSFSSRGT